MYYIFMDPQVVFFVERFIILCPYKYLRKCNVRDFMHCAYIVLSTRLGYYISGINSIHMYYMLAGAHNIHHICVLCALYTCIMHHVHMHAYTHTHMFLRMHTRSISIHSQISPMQTIQLYMDRTKCLNYPCI